MTCWSLDHLSDFYFSIVKILSQQQYSQPVHDKRGRHQTTSTVFAVFLLTLTCSCRKAKTMFLPMKSSSIGLFLITYQPTWDYFRFSFSRNNGIFNVSCVIKVMMVCVSLDVGCAMWYLSTIVTSLVYVDVLSVCLCVSVRLCLCV